MGTLAFPAPTHAFHDGGLARSISRTRSRRQSFSGLGYSGQQQVGIQFPHSDYGGIYDEPPMSGSLYGEVSIHWPLSKIQIHHSYIVPKTILFYLRVTQHRSPA